MAKSSSNFHVICSYDICNRKRLARVHRYLSNYGLAVNYSVFYLKLSTAQIQQHKKALKKLIHLQQDSLQFYVSVPYNQAQTLGQLLQSGLMMLE